MSKRSRRAFVGLSSAGLLTAAFSSFAWRRGSALPPPVIVTATPPVIVDAAGASLVEVAAPSPAPDPLPAESVTAGKRVESELMAGTPHATRVVEVHGAGAGPTVVVLGGVHGNEPGGWLAAEAIAEWPVTSGTLVVVPRANRQAVELLARTSAALGDLNRLYPGDPDGLPMSAMAYEITRLLRGHQPRFLFDLHESWGFYAERSADAGTAAVGQTVAVGGVGADMPLMEAVVREVNAHLAPREQLTLADRRGESTAWASAGNSSISLGQFVEGCSPVLVEMAQQDQPAARRAEMHVLLVRTALEHLGMA